MSVRLRALVGVYGASKFLAAALAGDMADDATIDARRAVCRDCPNRVRGPGLPGLPESDWCGEPLGGKSGVPRPGTCGCHIAAATIVGSKRCPSGKW